MVRSCSGIDFDPEIIYYLSLFRKAYPRWLTLIHYELYPLHFLDSLLRNGVQKCPIRLTYLLCFREKSLFWALYACDSKTRSVAPFLITIQSKYQVFFLKTLQTKITFDLAPPLSSLPSFSMTCSLTLL